MISGQPFNGINGGKEVIKSLTLNMKCIRNSVIDELLALIVTDFINLSSYIAKCL